MPDNKVAPKKSSGGVGLGIDFSLNPCASLLIVLIIPPILAGLWLLAR